MEEVYMKTKDVIINGKIKLVKKTGKYTYDCIIRIPKNQFILLITKAINS